VNVPPNWWEQCAQRDRRERLGVAGSIVAELLAEDTNEHQRAIPANAEPG